MEQADGRISARSVSLPIGSQAITQPWRGESTNMNGRGRWPIFITDVGCQYIEEKPRRVEPYRAAKAIFRDECTTQQVVAAAEHMVPSYQASTGGWERVVSVDTGDPDGWDRGDDPRRQYPVVTESDSADRPQEPFNAFPGRTNE